MLFGVPLSQSVLHDVAESHEQVAGDVVVGGDQRGLVAHGEVVVRDGVLVVYASPCIDVEESTFGEIFSVTLKLMDIRASRMRWDLGVIYT